MEPAEEKEDCNATHKKRHRHRKKQLNATILKQMEFYFSDASLSKSRFMSDLIAKDPYIPVETFLTFNKIKSLTDKTSDIVKALANSTLLELSEDGTKVKRINELVPYDPDPRTIYVESIPASADIKWLAEIFQPYGPVTYVSLPRFKGTNRIKGFAFVEYESPKSAEDCLKAFTAMGCKLPTNLKAEELFCYQGTNQESETNPKKDQEKSQNQKEKNDDKSEVVDDNPVETINEENEKDDVENKSNGECDVDEPPTKRIKVDDDVPNKTEAPNVNKDNIVIPKISITDLSEDGAEVDNSETTAETEKKEPIKKKKRRDRKKNKDDKKNINNAAKNLQILSKKEWKVLRNKYLTMQRKNMEVLKRALRTQHSVPENRGHALQSGFPFSEDNNDETEATPNVKPSADIPFVEGVLVAVKLPEPCLDVKQLKQSTKANVHVKYVDVKEGSTDVYIRMDESEAAKQFASSGIFPEMRILEGEEERLYWEELKLQQSRQSSSKRKMRGRDRLIKKAEQVVNAPSVTVTQPGKHIRFDD